ncbi:MAG: nucleotidyltransferase domain-containing protein [Firmicutes bacterium]|nr:nucleotidyltransferase domain-containing protein [Bacillota bacterium]
MANQERWQRFQPLPDDIGQKLKKLNPFFNEEGVLLVYLFGSLAKGLPGNDIDLAILGGSKPVYRLRERLAEKLGTERIDLIDLESASPLLRFEIISTGCTLYVADELLHEEFKLYTLHQYRDTAPLRRRQSEYFKERMAQRS